VPVAWMERDRCLVPLGDVERSAAVTGVAMRADDREYLPVAHHVQHGRAISAGIDDDDLLVIAKNPGIRGAASPRQGVHAGVV
jgi:hypothetical protein